jgi:outer membrane protein TolC
MGSFGARAAVRWLVAVGAIASMSTGAWGETAAPVQDEPPLPQVYGAVERRSFSQAVARALARSPQLATARQELERARALVEQTRAAALPVLSGAVTSLHLDADRVSNDRVISPQDQLNATLSLSVPLVSPRGWVQWGQSNDRVEVARAGEQEVRRQVAMAAARTYLALLTQHRLIEAAERGVAAARAHRDFAHQRLVGGSGTLLDESRAGEELYTSRTRAQQGYIQLLRLQEQLGVLLALDHPVDVVETDLRPAPDGASPGPTILDELLPPRRPATNATHALVRDERDWATLLASRSDLRLASRRVDTAARVRREGWADFMPSLTGNLQGFYQNPPSLTLPTTGWQLLVALTLPLYDGGLRYGLARERLALELQARLDLEATTRQAKAEVRTSELALDRAEAAEREARAAAGLANETLRLTTLAYRAGAGTNLEVIDAERRARDAETAVAIAEDSVRQAKLEVVVASGAFPQTR